VIAARQALKNFVPRLVSPYGLEGKMHGKVACYLGAASIVAVAGAGSADAGSIEDAIRKNGYTPISPPSTEGAPGSLYV